MIFDSHAHYDDKAFNEDREEVLQKLNGEKNVVAIVNSSIDELTQKFGIEYSKKYDFMWTTIGYHPECAEKATGDYIEKMVKYMEYEKAVAIGEIGLDYYWKTVPKDVQIKVFEEQLALAVDLDVPVVVHDREAHGDVLKILKKYRPKGVMHCFSGSLEFSKEILNLGMSLSFGGVVTFKNAKHSIDVVKEIPINKLLLETDAPYLAPVPYRGKRCDSSMIQLTAEKIAELRNMKSDEVLKITAENASALYNIKL